VRIVDVAEAQADLSDVERGEDITISRAGRSVAILRSVKRSHFRELGIDEGTAYWMADDFDDVIPPGFDPYVRGRA